MLVAVQPTRGLDVGAIENVHSQLVAERDAGKAVLLVSLELDEVKSLNSPFTKGLRGNNQAALLPYVISLVVLAFTSKKSRAPKAEGIPYDKGSR